MKKSALNILKIISASLLLHGSVSAEEPLIYMNDPCCQQMPYSETYDPCYQPVSYCETYDDPCCPTRTSFWAEAEYLYWQIKNSPNPVPMVATGPLVPNLAPVIGQPGTSVLIGGEDIKTGWRSGGRFSLGTWFCDDQVYGTEISYLFLGKRSKSQSVSSDAAGLPFLSLPFFNVQTGLESSTRISLPGAFTGLATLKIENRMQGAEWNGLGKLGCYNGFDVQALVGFRWWNFNENLRFATESPAVGVPTSVFDTVDKFGARNNFYGGQLGLNVAYTWDCFSINVKGKIALGAMRKTVNIRGRLVTNDFTGTTIETFEGGYFALPTNIGNHTKTQFSVIPEVNINLGYQISDNWSIKAGYTFLYVSNMFWAGDQIDREINPSQALAIIGSPAILAGEERPKALLKTSHFWAQGVNVGVEFRF